jgi:hypothetical protein
LPFSLTTKVKDKIGYHKFLFKEKEICALLGDIRKLDSRRLAEKLGKLPDFKFKTLEEEIRKVIFDPYK